MKNDEHAAQQKQMKIGREKKTGKNRIKQERENNKSIKMKHRKKHMSRKKRITRRRRKKTKNEESWDEINMEQTK